MTTGLVNIDGLITPIGEGRISVLDHGFLFGDSVYETLRTYRGKPFLFSKHFKRLEHSAKAVFLELPWTYERMLAEVRRTVEAASKTNESRIRITVTRGAGDVGPDPATCGTPVVIIFVTPLAELQPEVYENGVNVVISSFYRSRQLGDAKTGNLLRSVLALREAKAENAFEAITLTADGKISDGITSNLYLVQGSKLLTPSHDAGILEGITRAVVLDLARRAKLDVVEGIFDLREIARSSELFLTSSTREVVPIVQVDGKPVGSGRPGPVTKQLLEAYRNEVNTLLEED
jgi:branched-chain amino acid aminotransferase